MGYYITATEANWTVPADKVDAAFHAVKELNRNHSLKNGGFYGPDTPTRPAESVSVSDRPDKWFSWMDWNYDELCENIAEVFNELGFEEAYIDSDGNFNLGDVYDSKIGNEEHFLQEIAPFSEEDSYVIFAGEDGTYWRYIVRDGEMLTQGGTVVFE